MFVYLSVCGINAERQSVEALLASLTTDRRISSAMAEQSLDDEKELLKKEKNRARVARWQKANPERHCAKSKRWNKANPEKVAAYAVQWEKANPEKKKESRRKSQRKRHSTPEGKLNNYLSKHMRRCLSRTNETASQLKHSLPYTISELRTHLERQFTKGMSWEKRSEWHIDHIIPLSSFKFTSSLDLEFKAAWALSNLRPLWKKENLSKGKKKLTLL